MKLTPAGEQIERALAAGYEVAAFNLYADAMGQQIKLALSEDESDAEDHAVAQWHRSTQERVRWNEAGAQDGSILRDEMLPRNEEGVWEGAEPVVEYRENPDLDV